MARTKAAAAAALLNDPTFKEICDQITEDARILFFNQNSGITEWQAAHSKVRAVETFRAALQSRITDGAILDKREVQHRDND